MQEEFKAQVTYVRERSRTTDRDRKGGWYTEERTQTVLKLSAFLSQMLVNEDRVCLALALAQGFAENDRDLLRPISSNDGEACCAVKSACVLLDMHLL